MSMDGVRRGLGFILVLCAICFIRQPGSVNSVDFHVSNSELMHLLNLQTRIAEGILNENEEEMKPVTSQGFVYQVCKQFWDLLSLPMPNGNNSWTNGNQGKREKSLDGRKKEKFLSDYIAHPLNLFLIFYHWIESKAVWRDYLIESLTRGGEATRLIPSMLEMFPKKSDLDQFAGAIVRLQHVYDLDVKQLTSGQVRGRRGSRPLAKGECFFLADIAFQSGLRHEYLAWFDECEALFVRFEGERRERRQDCQAKMHTIDAFANGVRGPAHNSDHLSTLVSPGSVVSNIAQGLIANERGSLHSDEESGNAIDPTDPSSKVFEVYKKLCQLRENPSFQSSLFPTMGHEEICFFHHTNGRHGNSRRRSLSLDPFKAEVHALDPLIVSYHDVISEELMSELIHTNRARLRAPRSFSSSTGRVQANGGRTGKVGFSPEVDPRLERVAQAITSLSTEHVEPLQTVSYGVGGHYEPHLDYFRVRSESVLSQVANDRMATLLFYLNEVQGGGSTVFPTLGIAVPPRKGSALFWFNLFQNGTGDPFTLHSGCPVLLGTKDIANFWFRSHGQELRRPCSLNREM